MPDANREQALNQLVGAAFGAAGQRCMATTVAVLVGAAREWVPELVAKPQGCAWAPARITRMWGR